MELDRCYVVLELPPDASYTEAKAAFKLMAQVWHPDKHAHNEKLQKMATGKFQEISAAWDTLESHFTKEGGRHFEAGTAGPNTESEDFKIVTCPHCSTKNRMPSNKNGIAKCGNCQSNLYGPDMKTAGRYTRGHSTWTSCPYCLEEIPVPLYGKLQIQCVRCHFIYQVG